MPTRWLSLRRRDHPLEPTRADTPSTANPQDFDFGLAGPTGAFCSPSTNVRPAALPKRIDLRPATSDSLTTKRKHRVPPHQGRPQTSGHYRPATLDKAKATSRSQDNLIGLAFGSPSHPPSSFPDLSASRDRKLSVRHCSPAYEKPSEWNNKRWRKIGMLFKPRQNALDRGEIAAGPTIGLPTGFVVLDKSPTSQVHKFEGYNVRPGQPSRGLASPRRDAARQPRDQQDEKTGLPTEPVAVPVQADEVAVESSSCTMSSAAKPAPPKLEIDIPTPPMDRYSEIFRHLPAASRSSSLLARRSRTLDSLRSFGDNMSTPRLLEDENSDTKTNPSTPLMPPRRIGTPTATRSPSSTKYSLFPAPSPAPVKIVGRVPFAEQDHQVRVPLRRAATSPARLSPMQDHFEAVKPEPLHPKRGFANELTVSSPGENTASTDHEEPPWSTVHSIKSSFSSASTTEDIFFDIKSFRDSKGMEDGHFVMTRPDSVAVELARTRSKRAAPATKLRQMELSQPEAAVEKGDVADRSGEATKHTSVNTAQFDETIAAIEKLASANSTPERKKASILGLIDITLASEPEELAISHGDDQCDKPATTQQRSFTPPGDENARDPVASSPEKAEPSSGEPPGHGPAITNAASGLAGSARRAPTHLTMIKRIDRPIEDSPTIPQSPPEPRRPPHSTDTPPPVPKKDARFIPISKFAAKSTVAAIERAGINPTRPARAHTDKYPPRTTSLKENKERAATLPLAEAQHGISPKPALLGSEHTLQGGGKPRALNAVMTEVAIARTVSLSRKQSARVHVPGPKLAARRAEAHAHSQSQSTNQQPSGSAHTRTPSQRSLRVHRHKRSGSRSQSKDKIKIMKRELSEKVNISKETENQLIQEAKKWEVLEKRAYSPVVVQPDRGHKPGLSVGVVVESV